MVLVGHVFTPIGEVGLEITSYILVIRSSVNFT